MIGYFLIQQRLNLKSWNNFFDLRWESSLIFVADFAAFISETLNLKMNVLIGSNKIKVKFFDHAFIYIAYRSRRIIKEPSKNLFYIF